MSKSPEGAPPAVTAQLPKRAAAGHRVLRRQHLDGLILRLGVAVGLTPLEQAKAAVCGLRAESEGDCA